MNAPQAQAQAPLRLLLLGAGRMGGALLAGLRRADPAPEILVVDPNPAPGPERAVPSLADIGDYQPDVVVLAVKPGLIASLAPELRARLGQDAVVISFMAGVRVARLRELLGERRAPIRVMPNLALAVGAGVCGLWAPADAADGDVARATALLEGCGEVVRLPREEDLDAVTAISGSGPAYVFRFAEALTSAAVTLGLPSPVAARLARQTLIGVGAQLAADPSAFEAMRVRVTSPGGTTAAALAVLGGAAGLDDLVSRAVQAAAARAQSLGDEA